MILASLTTLASHSPAPVLHPPIATSVPTTVIAQLVPPGECLYDWMNWLDTFVHFAIILSPLLTLTTYGIERLISKDINSEKYTHYANLAIDVLIRLSAILLPVGLIVFVMMVGTSSSVFGCSQYVSP